MRIALKAVTGNATTLQAAGAKSSNVSFLDLLAQVSSQAVRAVVPAGANSEADSDPASGRESGKAMQSTTGDVEGAKNERESIQFVVTTCEANASLPQDGEAVRPTQPQPAQHCPSRSMTQQTQLKPVQAADCEHSNALLNAVSQLAAAQPADPQATISIAVGIGDSQAATGAEQSNSRQVSEITSIIDGGTAQGGSNAPDAAMNCAVPVSPMQAPLNSAQPIQDPGPITQQSSLQAFDAQASSDKAAPAQINEPGFSLPGSFGSGDEFSLVSSVSKSGNESISSVNAGQGRTADATNNAPHAPTGSAAPTSGERALLNSAQSTQDTESDAVQSNSQEPETKISSNEAAIAQVLAQGFSLPGSLPSGDTFFQFSSSSKNSAANIAPLKAGQLRTAGATNMQDSVESVSNAPASASKSITSQDVGTESGGIQGGQSSQHFQADNTQTIAVAGREAESSTPQPNVFAGHVAAGSVGQSDSVSRSTDATPLHAQEPRNLPSDQLDSGSMAGTSGINTARLVQSMSETEMRLGMHSTEFGDIAIRTSVSQQQMQAQISVDHSELGNAISAHIPSLQAKLGSDFGLHTSIEVNQAAGSRTGGHGQPAQQNQTPIAHPISAGGVVPAAEKDFLTIPAMPLSANDGRLDIRA